MDLDVLRYSQVWEDHMLLERSLAVTRDDDVLSVCSAGCNVLALLLQGPRSVTAVDMSVAQTALLELKIAGIRVLDHLEFVRLLGVRDAADRAELYRRLRHLLSEAAGSWWDSNQEVLEAGIVNAGRLDSYFHTFRERHLPEVWPEGTALRLLEAPDMDAQRREFRRADTRAFREVFRWYFGRHMMETHGRDPAQFKHVEAGDPGQHFHDRFAWACTEMPLAGNFYMEAFLTGRYRDLTRAHPYLHPERFAELGRLVDRVTVFTGELESFLANQPEGTFSKGNLSDIFEYMSPAASEQVFEALARSFRPGGMWAYWNLLVTRSGPRRLSEKIRPLRDMARELWRRDRSWFYSDFQVEAVRDPARGGSGRDA